MLLLAPAPLWATEPEAGVGNSDTTGARIAQLVDSAATHLDPRAAAALNRIDPLGPRLLALRSYLRAGCSLGSRWSWPDEDIARYEGSALQQALNAEIARVHAAFEADNPGFTPWVNPQVRSLDIQLQRRNENVTVAAAGDALLRSLRAAVAADAESVP